jgi:hypothetical protein
VIPMPNYHVTVHGADREVMAELGRARHVDVYCQTLAGEDTGDRVSALADEQTTVGHFGRPVDLLGRGGRYGGGVRASR